MTRKNGPTLTAQWNFTYDPLGNVRQLYDLFSSPVTLSYLSTDRDKICNVSYGGPPLPICNVKHDSFGNVVYEQTRTGYNKLTYFNSGDVRSITNKAGLTATFAYDAFGAVQDLDIVGSTELRHDKHYGDFITQRSSKSAGTSFVSRLFPGPGLTISRRGATGPWIFQFTEARGTRFTVDETGKFVQDVSYTPFGAASSTGAVAGSTTYTSDQWNDGDALDGFGLTQVGKRIYEPAIGRFLSRDPLMIPRTAATTNPYAFAMNDPINLSDPSGMDPCAADPFCIWTSTGDASSSGTAASLVALAGWAANYLSLTGVEPPMAASSVADIKAYSAVFDAHLTTVQMTGRFGYSNSGGFLSAVGDFGSGFGGAIYDAGAGAVHALADPVGTVKGIGHALRHPIETGEAIGRGIENSASAIMSGDWKAAGRAVGTLAATFGPGAAVKAVGELAEVEAIAGASELGDVSAATKELEAATGIPNETLVCRGGQCSADNFSTGTGVVTADDGTLSGVSTQSRVGANVETLSQPFKNNQVGVTTVGEIRQAGGSVVMDGRVGNPNHATVNGLTADKAEQLFRPTIQNPNPVSIRGTYPNMIPNH